MPATGPLFSEYHDLRKEIMRSIMMFADRLGLPTL